MEEQVKNKDFPDLQKRLQEGREKVAELTRKKEAQVKFQRSEKMCLEFTKLQLFLARKKPASLFFIYKPTTLKDPFSICDRFVVGENFVRMTKKLNNLTESRKREFDLVLENASFDASKISQFLSYRFLRATVQNFFMENFKDSMNIENFIQKDKVYELEVGKNVSFTFCVVSDELEFINNLFLEVLKSLAKIVQNSKTFEQLQNGGFESGCQNENKMVEEKELSTFEAEIKLIEPSEKSFSETLKIPFNFQQVDQKLSFQNLLNPFFFQSPDLFKFCLEIKLLENITHEKHLFQTTCFFDVHFQTSIFPKNVPKKKNFDFLIVQDFSDQDTNEPESVWVPQLYEKLQFCDAVKNNS